MSFLLNLEPDDNPHNRNQNKAVRGAIELTADDFLSYTPSDEDEEDYVPATKLDPQEQIGALYELYHFRHGSVPNLAALNKAFKTNFTQKDWDKFFSQNANLKRLADSAIPLPDDSSITLTRKQVEWIKLLLNPGNPGTPAQKAKAFGITLSKHYEWMRNPLYAEAVRIHTDNLLEDERYRVFQGLAKAAAGGNFQSARLFLELTGDYVFHQKMEVTASSEVKIMVQRLIDVLQKHLSPEQMLDVQSDLEAVLFPQASPVINAQARELT